MTDAASLAKQLNEAALALEQNGDPVTVANVCRQVAETISRLAAPLPEKPTNCAWPNCNPADQLEGRCCGWIESGISSVPPPEEIASAMAGLAVIRDSTIRPELRDYARTAAAALRSQAAEVERLKRTGWCDIGAVAILKQRIRELEAERDKLSKQVHLGNEAIECLKNESAARCREAVAERDAIRAKTIEECARAAQNAPMAAWADNDRAIAAGMRNGCARAIRALAQSPEGTSAVCSELVNSPDASRS